jgi:superfamily I DNA/RNA helicase
VQAKTAHGLGLSLLKDAGIDTRRGLNAHKVRDLITAAGQSDGLYRDYASTISKLVSQAKQAALGVFGSASDVERWQGLADHYGIELEDAYASRIIAAAQDVYTRSCADRETFDFDDMILLPLLAKLSSRFPADFLFVDEAQDLSPARQALLAKFVKPKFGRLIVVGDPAQAIYGFAGADARAFQNLISDWRCTVLPLSVTFRCPKAVVAEAQKIVPDITAADSAPEGVVRGEASLPPVLVPGEDAILCRNTAPLISQAYALIRAGIPAKVEGRDIGEGLAALARRWKVRTCAELLARLDAHQEREAAKLAKRPDGEEQVERLADRLDTLREIVFACQAKGLQLVTDVTSAIADLFGDDVSKTKAAVTLATYHRSKGREWERVFLLEHAARCPSRAARQQWQLEQEYNLAYVAITRAKRELVYVG